MKVDLDLDLSQFKSPQTPWSYFFKFILLQTIVWFPHCLVDPCDLHKWTSQTFPDQILWWFCTRESEDLRSLGSVIWATSFRREMWISYKWKFMSRFLMQSKCIETCGTSHEALHCENSPSSSAHNSRWQMATTLWTKASFSHRQQLCKLCCATAYRCSGVHN